MLPSSVSHEVWGGVLVAGLVALAVSLDDKAKWYVAPGRLLLLGFGGVFCVNAIAFTVNLFLSMRKWPRSKDVDELEEVAIPALQGDVSEIKPVIVRVMRFVTAICVGVMTGSLAGLVWRLWR
jgi:hypothetical protein